MKMVMISYNEAIDEEVMDALEACGLKSYTKVCGTFGRGESSGTHLGNDIWPGRNNLLFVALPDENSEKALICIRDLRRELGKEGVKAFVWDLAEVTRSPSK